MSMRARDKQDYRQGDNSKISEGEGLGMMGGKHRDEMNSMFDTRGRDAVSNQKNLITAMEDAKKNYDR